MAGLDCYQCGKPLIISLPEDASDDDWMTCANCGENAITVRDWLKELRGTDQGSAEAWGASLEEEARLFRPKR